MRIKHIRKALIATSVLMAISAPSSATIIEMDLHLLPEIGVEAVTGTIQFDTDQTQVSNFNDNGNDQIEVNYTDLITDYLFHLHNGPSIDMGSIVSSTFHAYTHGTNGCSQSGVQPVESSLSLSMSNGVFSVINAESDIDCSYITGLDGSNSEQLIQDLLPELLFSTSSSGSIGHSIGQDYVMTAGHWTWSVPEPSTFALLCIGFIGIGAARKLAKS